MRYGIHTKAHDELAKVEAHYDAIATQLDGRTARVIALEAERAELAAELASQVAWKERYLRDYMGVNERVHALEAHLRKADRIEGDIGAEQWYAERDALLASSPPETQDQTEVAP